MVRVPVISEAIQRQIQDEPEDMPYNAIAKKYGITWYAVKNLRMRVGKMPQTVAKVQATQIERVAPVAIEGGTMYDRVIEALEEQVAIYSQALETVRGLRDALNV
jgi:hypothetical protein